MSLAPKGLRFPLQTARPRATAFKRAAGIRYRGVRDVAFVLAAAGGTSSGFRLNVTLLFFGGRGLGTRCAMTTAIERPAAAAVWTGAEAAPSVEIKRSHPAVYDDAELCVWWPVKIPFMHIFVWRVEWKLP